MLSRSFRAAGLLAVGLVTGAALSGCGADAPRTAPAAAGRPAPAAPAADTGPSRLAMGLLPAEAFGPGATVTPLPADRLRQAGAMAGTFPGLQLTPDGCASALQQVLPQLAAVQDAAAQVARAGSTVTAELLAVPGTPVDAVEELTSLTQACSTAQAGAAGYGTATVSVAPVAVPALGDGAAAVTVTLTAQLADGAAWTGTGLAGVVQDGNRVLAVAQASPHGDPLDPASFVSLVQQAFQTQAGALD